MTAMLTALRWDIVLQARNGFYWASAFLVAMLGALLLNLPEAARANSAIWVPAILMINLQITTFFFVAGLMLLERDEGTLAALAVSPLSASGYLAMRTLTLTGLAAVETIALVWIGFGASGSWWLILAGTAALGVIYTGFGAAIAVRYESVNALLLPASAFVALLLLPLLPHFGFAPRWPFLVHPLEPPMILLRVAYGPLDRTEIVFGIAGSLGWSALAFAWGRNRVRALMQNTRASGGR
jgi:fluoroquinolone transport system permease protein